MHVFRREYVILSGMIIIQVIASFTSPLGIKQLLQLVIFSDQKVHACNIWCRYLETGGTDATIRPWFWILWLFMGPCVVSLAMQWYTYIVVCGIVHFIRRWLTSPLKDTHPRTGRRNHYTAHIRAFVAYTYESRGWFRFSGHAPPGFRPLDPRHELCRGCTSPR